MIASHFLQVTLQYCQVLFSKYTRLFFVYMQLQHISVRGGSRRLKLRRLVCKLGVNYRVGKVGRRLKEAHGQWVLKFM